MSKDYNERLDQSVAMAVHHAQTGRSMLIDRGMLAGMAGQGLDQKRTQAWCEYGYPMTVTAQMLYNLYSRGGLANGAVNKVVDTCWRYFPDITEGDESEKSEQDSQWDKEIKQVFKQSLWSRVKTADMMRLVTGYSGLILRIADSGGMHEPVRKMSLLKDAIPAWGGVTLTPYEFDDDPFSENYGDVKMWQYRQTLGNGSPVTIKVHPERVVIFGSYDNSTIPYLQPSYNNFVNIEKIEGAPAESLIKNSARSVHLDFTDKASVETIARMMGVKVEDLHERLNDIAKDLNTGNDIALVTQGVTSRELVSNVPDPRPAYEVNTSSAATGLKMPVKILIGMQTGERASTEDRAEFNANCYSRCKGDLTLDITRMVEQFMRIRLLRPIGEFAVNWQDLTDSDKPTKLDNAGKMSRINVEQASIGALPPYTGSEIRMAGGDAPEVPVSEFEPLPDDADE